jgi:TrmH RNA methyltransferase
MHRDSPKPRAANPPASARPERLLRVAGLAAVSALFRHAPERVVRLFYEARRVPDVGDFCARMAEFRRPYRRVDENELATIAGTLRHGGVVAVAEPQPERLLSAGDMIRRACSGETWFVLDGVGNPHNVGAIARSLAFFGFKALVLSHHALQAGLSDAAYRTAEGGLDCLEIFRVRTLPTWLRQIKPEYQVMGTALDRRGVSLQEIRDDGRPRVIVLGNEETGLSLSTLEASDVLLTLPGAGEIQSLNVAATAAILAYAASERLGTGWQVRPSKKDPRRERGSIHRKRQVTETHRRD